MNKETELTSQSVEVAIRYAIMYMILLFGRQNHLLSLSSLRHAFLGVFPNILGSPFDSRKLLFLDLSRLLNGFRHMTVIFDSPNLWHVRVSADKRLIVFEFLTLSGAFNASSGRCIGAPYTDISIVGSR